MSIIDWEMERNLIKADYRLNDSQLAYALRVLDYAITIYNKSEDFPQTILLYGKDGTVFRSIKIIRGQPRTDEIRLPFMYGKRMATAVTIASLVIVTYYFIRKR